MSGCGCGNEPVVVEALGLVEQLLRSWAAFRLLSVVAAARFICFDDDFFVYSRFFLGGEQSCRSIQAPTVVRFGRLSSARSSTGKLGT